MDTPDNLAHVKLSDGLNSVCRLIARLATDDIGDVFSVVFPNVIGPGFVEEGLPGEVFNFAVRAKWIPPPYEPEEDHGIVLGSYYVEESYRFGASEN